MAAVSTSTNTSLPHVVDDLVRSRAGRAVDHRTSNPRCARVERPSLVAQFIRRHIQRKSPNLSVCRGCVCELINSGLYSAQVYSRATTNEQVKVFLSGLPWSRQSAGVIIAASTPPCGRNTLHRALPFAFAAAAAAIISLTAVSPTVIAEDITSRGCSNSTLRGDYGIAVSGVRAIGANATETFVGTGVRTYDGEGGFTQIDNIHGQTTQVSLPQANGTYEGAPIARHPRIFPVGTPSCSRRRALVSRRRRSEGRRLTPR